MNVTWQREQLNPASTGVQVDGTTKLSVQTNCDYWELSWYVGIVYFEILRLVVDNVTFCPEVYLYDTNNDFIQSCQLTIKPALEGPGVRYTQPIILESSGTYNVLNEPPDDNFGQIINSLFITRYYKDNGS